MSGLLFTNCTVVGRNRLFEDYYVLCRKGKVVEVGPGSPPKDADAEEMLDAGGMYLAPGFIDLHTHGLLRWLVDDGPDALAGICMALPRFGVTSFLPTLCPRPKGEDAEFVSRLAGRAYKGAKILGFHQEGPFLAICGALPPGAMGKADPDRASDLIEAAEPYKTIFSISPDFEGIDKLILLMLRDNSPVFISHTRADVRQTRAAIEAGARHATHFYDVFYAPKETDPGVRPCGAVEAVLADDRVSVDFILDGEHVDPVAVNMALKCKGPEKVCLITDANVGAGLSPGKHKFGDTEIEFRYEGGPARLVGDSSRSGLLAGSGLTLDRALRNAVEMLGVDLVQGVKMVSANPARVLGLDRQKGTIAGGYDADMVLLDKDLNVQKSWIEGKCYFDKN
jgi:N-acetylglucosamine-6-phosphate deacetylase